MVKYIYVLFFISVGIFAQQSKEDLITDRPDQTESAVSVPLKTLQIEFGFSMERQSYTQSGMDYKFTSLSLGSSLLRYGLFQGFELRLGGEYTSNKQEINKIETTTSGLSSVLVGAKYELLQEKKSVPQIGVLFHLNLPVGNKDLRSDKVEPEIILSVAKDLSDVVSLGVNLGGSHLSQIKEINYIYSIASGISLSEKVGCFLEFYGDFLTGRDPMHNFDGGLTYLLKDNLQVDISGGVQILRDNPSYFVSTGVSLRLPN